jgi:hypothetical protein
VFFSEAAKSGECFTSACGAADAASGNAAMIKTRNKRKISAGAAAASIGLRMSVLMCRSFRLLCLVCLNCLICTHTAPLCAAKQNSANNYSFAQWAYPAQKRSLRVRRAAYRAARVFRATGIYAQKSNAYAMRRLVQYIITKIWLCQRNCRFAVCVYQ